MDALVPASDREVTEAPTPSTKDVAPPNDAIVRLPGENEGLGLESLEERALLSAEPTSKAAAPPAAPPEEPPALVGSPVAGGAAVAGSGGEQIIADGRSAARALDAAEVVAELAKASAATTSGAAEHKLSHSTESGEIGELKLEFPHEQATEINESEKLEHSTEPENKVSDERGNTGERIDFHRPVAGEVRLDAQTDVQPNSVVSGETAESAAALARTHAEKVIDELQIADEAAADVQQPSALAARSQSIDTPQAHDAYFAATPDLAAYPGVESAVAAPVLSDRPVKGGAT